MCACILSDVGLINDVCVGGPQFCAYRDVVGNGAEPCCSLLLSSQAKEKKKIHGGERDGLKKQSGWWM